MVTKLLKILETSTKSDNNVRLVTMAMCIKLLEQVLDFSKDIILIDENLAQLEVIYVECTCYPNIAILYWRGWGRGVTILEEGRVMFTKPDSCNGVITMVIMCCYLFTQNLLEHSKLFLQLHYEVNK